MVNVVLIMKKYKISFLLETFIAGYLSLILFNSCSRNNYSSSSLYNFTSKTKLPNYNNLDYWAAHPWKKDLSDSVPKPLQQTYIPDSLADVFFIHPTTLTDKADNRWNADINDAEINARTDYSTILYQASVFNKNCRVFAPRYRQAHIRSFFIDGADSEEAFQIDYEDVKAAFINYLTNYNNNRPIIIASHSQGTKHASRLLKEFFDNKPLLNNLVCAYIIGLPVPENYFSFIKPCEDSLSTGCVISWRTFKSGSSEPQKIANENFKSIVINPLSWKIETGKISSSYNKGGILRNFNKIIPGVVNAQIHNNVLWTSKPNMPGKIFFFRKNYHIGDINLFYINIRENAEARIKAFLKNTEN